MAPSVLPCSVCWAGQEGGWWAGLEACVFGVGLLEQGGGGGLALVCRARGCWPGRLGPCEGGLAWLLGCQVPAGEAGPGGALAP